MRLKPSMWLTRCRSLFRSATMFNSERQYFERCQSRPMLSDDEFIRQYYPSGINREIPLRIRRILGQQLKLEKIIPTDDPCDILQDVDLLEIMREIGEEFGFFVESKELEGIDGNFDSIVSFVNAKLSRQNR